MELSNALSEQLAKKFGSSEENLASNNSGDHVSDGTTMARLAGLIAKVSGIDATSVSREQTASDVGLGSLERIEVAVRAESEFSVRLDDRKVQEMTVVGEFADYLDELQESP